VIDGATNTVVATVPVGYDPEDVAVNPATNRIYTANYDTGNVSVIDGATNTVVATVPAGSHPYGAAVNLIANRVYVANQLDNTVSVIQDYPIPGAVGGVAEAPDVAESADGAPSSWPAAIAGAAAVVVVLAACGWYVRRRWL
jgi:YVTN family beta-propeller protein